MSKLVVIEIEELRSIISEAVKSEVSKCIKPTEVIPAKEYLSRQEVAKILKINLSTLYHWSRKGKLPQYSIGNRVLYLRSDIEAAMIKTN